MKNYLRYLSYLILIATVSFNLYLNFPETKVLADPNDNIFQYSLVARTNWIWENYHCPFSPSCLPNLVDHNVPAWAEGYPLPYYYSHLPQIAIVSSYNLLVHPISSIFQPKANPPLADNFSLYQYYNWTKYLLLCFFPIPVFLALRLVGFSTLLAAFSAFFASHLSTDGLYGIDPPSFLWRGYGLTSQLYAMIFMPLALAFFYRAMRNENYESGIMNQESNNKFAKHGVNFRRPLFEPVRTLFNKIKKVYGIAFTNRQRSGRAAGQENLYLRTNYTIWAAVFLSLTTAGHLGMGIITFISTVPFVFLDLDKTHLTERLKKAVMIYIFALLPLVYWIIPMLLKLNYHIVSFWDPIWKFNSYGWYEVVQQFLQGEIFDWQRLPIITVLVVIGFFALLLTTRLFPFALLFAFWFLMYFGRTTWGNLLDLIPGMKDFHQHRFIVGIHIAALFLIPAGLEYLLQLLNKIITFAKHGKIFADKLIFYVFSIILISIIIYFTAKQTIDYASFNNRWINEANIAYQYDQKNFQDLVSFLKSQPNGRIYAGRPGNWGRQFKLGSTQLYMLLGIYGFDMSQFLPETWSMLSENEQNFDERVAEDYDLLNIRYIVADSNHDFTPKVKQVKQFGPFKLFEVPTSGWFDVVNSPMFVQSDKNNFINIVNLWHRSYPRRWNMYPLISVEKKPVVPQGLKRVIKMTDEVSYIDLTEVEPKETILEREIPQKTDDQAKIGYFAQDNQNQDETKAVEKFVSEDLPRRNIFSDFPFVFPEATISGRIKREKIEKQTYSATVEVPDNCKNCMVMFKMSYHPDWQVKVDGQSVEKYAVFPFYLAAQVTPGEHTVEFTYQPNRLKTILLVMEVILLILFVFRKRIFQYKYK